MPNGDVRWLLGFSVIGLLGSKIYEKGIGRGERYSGAYRRGSGLCGKGWRSVFACPQAQWRYSVAVLGNTLDSRQAHRVPGVPNGNANKNAAPRAAARTQNVLYYRTQLTLGRVWRTRHRSPIIVVITENDSRRPPSRYNEVDAARGCLEAGSRAR